MAEDIELGKAYYTVGADTSQFKKQIADLKAEARAFGTLIHGVNKVANTLAVAVVAPIHALATAGVYKFMQTTDVGAYKLKQELIGLKYEWDQMLARVGAAIYRHGELSKVIEKLKNFISKIDEKQIMRILEIGKWTAILVVVTKMATYFGTMAINAEKMYAAFKKLQALGWFGGIGNAISSSIGSTIGAGVGAAAGVGVGSSSSKILEIMHGKGKVSMSVRELGEAGVKDADIMKSLEEKHAYSSKAQSLLEEEIEVVSKSASSVGKLISKLARLGGDILFFVPVLIGFFKGISEGVTDIYSKSSFLTGLISKAWSNLKNVFTFIMLMFDAVWEGLKSLGYYLGRMPDILLKGGLLTEGGRKAIGDMLETIRKNIVDTIGKGLNELFNPEETEQFENLKKKEPETFSFGHQFMGTSSLTDLNKIFQEMALQDQVIDLSKMQLSVLQQIANNTSKQGNQDLITAPDKGLSAMGYVAV